MIAGKECQVVDMMFWFFAQLIGQENAVVRDMSD